MINFIGPSYPLGNKAASERSINLFLSQIESGTGKAPFILKSIPGLSLFASLGAEYRGSIVTAGRAFVVAGNTLYELSSAGVATSRGTLLTSTSRVSIAAGVTQVVIVDGPYGYVLTQSSNAFTRITSPNFQGSRFVTFLHGYFCFIRPTTQQYYISAIDDAATFNALEFASAESSPDKLQVLITDHDELKLFGEMTVETASDTGGADFPFSRNGGALMEVGCLAPDSAVKLDNSIYWIGQNDSGGGLVYKAAGYQPQIISDDAIGPMLQASTNLAAATAYGYQQGGKTFYCINAPGLSTTLVYEAKSGKWSERAELDTLTGGYKQHRATGYLYAFNKCLVGSADGRIYVLDPLVNNNAGDVLLRDRISPHSGTGQFPRFALDCTVGVAASGQDPQVMMRYSNTGTKGLPNANWQSRSLGKIGEFDQLVVWLRCGFTRPKGSRVWQVRCTDDVAFDIIGAAA